jgi:ABC-2 type transport system ATP-binding protein
MMRGESANGLSIETAGLVKRYGAIVALDNVDLAVPRAAVGLLGPNGAGKSTLLKILLGLSRPNGGSARVLGRDAVADGRELRMRVGYMPETETLPDNATAADFVAHMAEMSGIPRRAAPRGSGRPTCSIRSVWTKSATDWSRDSRPA